MMLTPMLRSDLTAKFIYLLCQHKHKVTAGLVDESLLHDDIQVGQSACDMFATGSCMQQFMPREHQQTADYTGLPQQCALKTHD